ncbi:hypothetical protein COCON_G00052050, partial [Conger conger]
VVSIRAKFCPQTGHIGTRQGGGAQPVREGRRSLPLTDGLGDKEASGSHGSYSTEGRFLKKEAHSNNKLSTLDTDTSAQGFIHRTSLPGYHVLREETKD